MQIEALLFLPDDTNSLSLANFVGCVVGFLSVCTIRFRHLLLAAALSFESEMA
jgi:hypothetical protein